MSTPQQLEAKFWRALWSDRTMMIGLDGIEDGHARPMTAQLVHDDKGPIWFFASRENAIVGKLGTDQRAIATFTSKGHDLFATVHGSLSVDQNRALIDALWSSELDMWFPGGKGDPRLALLRLDAETAEIWLDPSSIATSIKLLFGADPKEEYKDNVARVALRQG